MNSLFKRANKELDLVKEPLTLSYYSDGTLLINKRDQREILSSVKASKLKEIELLNYSINNLQTQLLIIQKIAAEKTNNIENSKQEMIANLKKEINPDLLCSICFENRINLVLTPCGHTFCSSCFNLTKNKECFTCRTPVDKGFTIFMG